MPQLLPLFTANAFGLKSLEDYGMYCILMWTKVDTDVFELATLFWGAARRALTLTLPRGLLSTPAPLWDFLKNPALSQDGPNRFV
jgi:hypothetical protein